MKLKELVKAVRTLESLQYEKTDIHLSYKIMKLLKLTKDEVDFYDQTAQEIVKKFALKDEKGNYVQQNGNVILDAKFKEDIEKETMELNEKEVEVPNIKFHVVDFENLKLSVVDLMNIEKFLIEEE